MNFGCILFRAGYALHFHQGSLRKGFHGNGAAGRERGGEKLGIHLVHGAEIGHIGQKDGGFHDVAQRQAARLENGLGVGDALAGLLLDAALRECAGGGVDGQLAGNEDESGTGIDSLAVRADGRRGLLCLNGFHRTII